MGGRLSKVPYLSEHLKKMLHILVLIHTDCGVHNSRSDFNSASSQILRLRLVCYGILCIFSQIWEDEHHEILLQACHKVNRIRGY